jgi:pimeloyl-ACP methyl ester carboxylesterase
MTNISGTQATDGVATYADYYPAWMDKLAGDVTLEGSMLDGVLQGADAIRAVIGGVRELYDRQDFNFAGPCSDSGFIEDYTAEVGGRPLGCLHLITFNADGQTQHIAAHYRPLTRFCSSPACCARGSPEPLTPSTSSPARSEPNRAVSAANGTDYAYREVGEGTPALVLLQHFRGNLHNWDPALVDALAHNRRVVTFDNAGVAGSTGTTPSTITQMARDAIAFLDALELGAVDPLGFSIGSFVAQEIALIRPAAVRRPVLASAAPRGAAGMHRWAPEVIGAAGAPEPNPDSDPMILPHFSHLLAGLIPQARVKIYPDAAHGFLFQHHAEFARDVDAFLRE